MWHLPILSGLVAVLIASSNSLGAQGDRSERIDTWAKAAQSVPRSGWVTSTNVTYYPDAGDKGTTTTRRAVVQGQEFLVVEEVTTASATDVGFTRVFIANPDYVTQLVRIDGGLWAMEKLSIYTDTDFAKNRKAWFRLDPMSKFSNYHGTLSVLLSDEYVVTDQKTDGTRERLDVRVTNGPKHEDYAVSWSDIESLSAVFEPEIPIPVELSGKERGRNRYFSRTLSNCEKIEGTLVPLTHVLKTDDKDISVVAIQETTLDFSEYGEPVDQSVFYLSHYGLPEPELKTRFRSKLLYGCIIVACLAIFGLIAKLKLKRMR